MSFGNAFLSFLSGKTQCLFLLAVFSLASSVASTAQCAGVLPSPTGSVIWTANWCDEFNGALNSPINSANWTFDTGSSGFGNGELEDYCDPSSNTAPCDSTNPNAFIDGSGHLAIQVRGPAGSDCTTAGTCTSARLNTSGHQTFHSGRIEAYLQIPSQTGLWPAFWNLGSQSGVSWPTVGESDVMENWPTTSNIHGPGATGNCSTIHTALTGGSGKGHCFTFPTGQQIDTAFHTYGQIWSANMIQYYIDNPTQPYFVVTASDLPAGDTWPFSSAANPFFIIMNVAVGGTLGNPTNTNTSSPAPMLVDYVRQYLPSAVPAPLIAAPTPITVTHGATTGNTTTLNLTGTLGSGRATFSCTTTAPKASCIVTTADPVNKYTVDFTSSTTASATVTVSTTLDAAAAGLMVPGLMASGKMGSGKWSLPTGIALTLMLFVLLRNGRDLRRVLAVSSVALFIAILPSCGGGGGYGGGGGGGGGGTGTTPGNYTVTVNVYTVSSSDAATPAANSTFNLTVN